MIKYYLFILVFFITSCTNQTIYSGKILNQEKLENLNFENKKKLLDIMGTPSYVEPIDNKYFYYSKKEEKKSIFNKKIEYHYIFIFEFDKNDRIINSKVYDLENINDFELVKDETENEVIKRGLLEKIFGGVGPEGLPNTQ